MHTNQHKINIKIKLNPIKIFIQTLARVQNSFVKAQKLEELHKI
jgi:hypothetical protein